MVEKISETNSLSGKKLLKLNRKMNTLISQGQGPKKGPYNLEFVTVFDMLQHWCDEQPTGHEEHVQIEAYLQAT